jgi:predicted ferric reductase
MFIIVILSIVPVIIWGFMEPLGLRFLDFNSITTSIGQILGLVGMVIFSITLILAGRFKFLDKFLKGLDKVYSNHHKLGAIAFSMLLFHPLFLVVKYLSISIRDAGLFFVPFTNMPITWGLISLLLMIIFLGITFYSKVKYHVWKFTHKFMTLAFFFAVIHTLVISSDISRNILLRYYILLLALVALFAVIRKTFFEQISANRFKYKVKNVNKLNQDVIEIEMEPLDKKMLFSPGQFAFFSFLGGSISKESHPFSISSSRMDNNLKIIVKNLGDFTSGLSNLKLNDGVLVDGPYGNFSYKKIENKNQIWIAGGIGITPFLSMAKTLESDYKVDLYYSVKENKEAVSMEILSEIEKSNLNFKSNLWIANDKGYINAGLISSQSDGLKDKDIFLCGPVGFMESLKNQFVSLGVDIKKIHYENFSL